LRRFVIERADSRCEYCRLSQEGQEATFHLDHIIPKLVGGETIAENLALACVSCSLRKAARQSAIAPQTGREVSLYNPRSDDWHDHFKREGENMLMA
jgi:5-methylcytosine-specific restriction endonuclease McrA